MIRAFIALPLPDNIKAALGSVAEVLKKSINAKWVKPENMHLTLKFLGEIDERIVKDLSKTLDDEASKFEPFDMRLSNTGVFPSRRKARVIWAGIDTDIDRLRLLVLQIEHITGLYGVPCEKRIFSSHITLARLKLPAVVDVDIKVPALDFNAMKINFYKSDLSLQGAKYSVLHSSPFMGASGG